MFVLMSIVHEVINIATLNLTEHVSKAHSHVWPNKVHTLHAHAAISYIVVTKNHIILTYIFYIAAIFVCLFLCQ